MTEFNLAAVADPNTIITPIDNAVRFPESLTELKSKYERDIAAFKDLTSKCASSADLLSRIRSNEFKGDRRMALLKIFRRCVSPVLDTETSKKVKSISTESLIENYGYTFKPIEKLKEQFAQMSPDQAAALAALIGEYDTRGQLGYLLTDQFFNWFEQKFEDKFSIEGPRGAGRDVELSSVFANFQGNYPCDFVIREIKSGKVLAIGFARYDSTRGGAQSDDRTGGNSDKVSKAKEYLAKSEEAGTSFRILFLADGPGLAHKDTWAEARVLDGGWDGNVRVVTLKTAEHRITDEWLLGAK
jgi:hypothetical protein